MTTISHEPLGAVQERRHWSSQLLVREMWASLAIVVIWLAVLFTAVFGPDIVANSGTAGVGTSTSTPSAVVVALFAFLSTWVVARYGFGRRKESGATPSEH
jgi:hypothetical protein